MCNWSCSSVRPAVVHPYVCFRGINLNVGRYSLTFQIHFFYTCNALGHHRLLPSQITFSGSDLGWGSQGQPEAKSSWFDFLAHASTDQDEMVMKHFKMNILIPLLSEIYWIMLDDCRVSDCTETTETLACVPTFIS